MWSSVTGWPSHFKYGFCLARSSFPNFSLVLFIQSLKFFFFNRAAIIKPGFVLGF